MRPIFGILLGAIVVSMGACSGTHEPHHDRPVPVSVAPQPLRNVPGVAVAKLLSLSIDEINQRLGPPLPIPASFVDPTMVPLIQNNEQLDSTMLFRHRGLAIVASYNYNTRRVSDLLLLGANESELMNRAQLRLGAEKYLVLPVFQKHRPTQLLGLRVLAVALNQ